jgi:hypothetical protein
MNSSPRYRIFVIGAGFSVHAGLPLGNELFEAVRDVVRHNHGSDNKLEKDLDWYLRYRHHCDGLDRDAPVDYERFMSYLDLEHYLQLRGSDTWSDEGNISQILIRNGIQEVIWRRTPRTPTKECLHFCQQLLPGDIILTFNYDTLIETSLDYLGKQYRLFPNRLKEVGPLMSIVDSEKEENDIQISKLHGSIDWYDKTPYIEDRKLATQHPYPWESKHPLFKDGSRFLSTRLIQGPCNPGDPLGLVYRVSDLSELVSEQSLQFSPLLLSPSSSKILYANPLKSLWRGLQQAGGLNYGLGIIGYSLPSYDEYARQALYHLMRNYTEYHYDSVAFGHKKSPAKIIDFVQPGSSDWIIRKNYSFMNWSRTELNTNGFCFEGIDWIML